MKHYYICNIVFKILGLPTTKYTARSSAIFNIFVWKYHHWIAVKKNYSSFDTVDSVVLYTYFDKCFQTLCGGKSHAKYNIKTREIYQAKNQKVWFVKSVAFYASFSVLWNGKLNFFRSFKKKHLATLI